MPGSEKAASPLLALDGISAGYGAVNVLHEVTLSVAPGEVVGLLGRNGAGKTTCIRAICGLLPLRGGAIRLAGEKIDGLGARRIAALGVATVPEGRAVFRSLSVAENLAIGAYTRRAGLRPLACDFAPVFELFPRLKERRGQLAGTLSGGEQQMLAMGRALMSQPRLLLLDEPSMGLAPMLIDLVFDVIDRLARAGMTILLVEQNAAEALDIADRAYLLEQGRVTRSGRTDALEREDQIRASYLGGETIQQQERVT
jgi:branched-chain amino acid transport system ATP-binding protein